MFNLCGDSPNSDKTITWRVVTAIVVLYFSFSVAITAGQLYFEFQNEKREIQDSIAFLVENIRTPLQDALGASDDDRVIAILEGIAKSPYVAGCEIYIAEEGNYRTLQTVEQDLAYSVSSTSIELGYPQKFSIAFSFNSNKLMSELTVFSNTAAVFDRSYNTFFVAIVSLVLKALVLWILAMFFVNRFVGKPLKKLQNDALEYSFLISLPDDNESQKSAFPIAKNELQNLQRCFESLQNKLDSQNYFVNNQQKHLEALVTERTFELNQSVEKLVLLDKTKSIFLANVSHELRTPLNAIIGFTRRLLKQTATTSTLSSSEVLGIILRNSEHLLNLINQILDMTKLASGKVELKIEDVSIRECIEEVVLSLKPLAEEKNIDINVANFPECFIMADHFRVRQILMNLIANAVKFTDSGSVNINLVNKFHENIPGLLITVSDTGIGISSEDIPKLFQQFQQLGTASLNTVAGTGLGLAIVDELVALHRGTIEVSSELGKGSHFTLWLPESQLFANPENSVRSA